MGERKWTVFLYMPYLKIIFFLIVFSRFTKLDWKVLFKKVAVGVHELL